MELGHIYIIKNRINDLKYVGQAKKFRKNKKKEFGYNGRFKEHISSNPTYHMDRVIKKLGPENFYVELLEECSLDKMDEREVHHIMKNNTLHPHGYNIVLGNPNKNSNPEVISEKLKEHYSDYDKRKTHSDIHLNNFNEINTKDLVKIEIKPIKQKGEDKLIYVYFKYTDDKLIRRRYGGIHTNFDENYKRCINDLNKLGFGCKIIDLIKDKNQIQNSKLSELGNISKIELRIHTMKERKLISLNINNTDNKKRIVFGGKTLSTEMAFINALNFIKNNNINFSKVHIHEIVKATLPNCGKLLRDLDTTPSK
jgi:hypothetical protein